MVLSASQDAPSLFKTITRGTCRIIVIVTGSHARLRGYLRLGIALALTAAPPSLFPLVARAQSSGLDEAYLAVLRRQSLSSDAIGDLKMKAGDPWGAQAAYQEGLAIARRLAAAEPDNSQWQADIVVSLWKLSKARQGLPDKISLLKEALAFVSKIEERGPLAANQRNWRAMIVAEIARLNSGEAEAAPASQRSNRMHPKGRTP